MSSDSVERWSLGKQLSKYAENNYLNIALQMWHSDQIKVWLTSNSIHFRSFASKGLFIAAQPSVILNRTGFLLHHVPLLTLFQGVISHPVTSDSHKKDLNINFGPDFSKATQSQCCPKCFTNTDLQRDHRWHIISNHWHYISNHWIDEKKPWDVIKEHNVQRIYLYIYINLGLLVQ